MASEPVVSLEGLTKRYETTTAVDDLSFTVSEGEFFTLVGPSGCGKTTTLRLLGGFEDPTEGSIRLRGRDVTGVPPEARDIGVVFQSYALFPHMTVGENVGYGLNFEEPPGGMSREERVAELLELVGLDGFEERDPTALSGGQRQRVAIARALAPGPDLLLLDEPMSALDARLRERLRVELKTLQQELDITTVYVTHDQEEALAISDRMAVMHDGAAEQVGTPRAVYDRPATRFVAEFVGDNNVFSGTVTGRDGERISIDLGPTTVVVQSACDAARGDTAVACVRPEQFSRDGGTNQLVTDVESAEFLGWTTRLHLDWHGQELLARTDAALSGTVPLCFEPEDAHIVTVE
nr:ABC transporter ATP-binding protein [Halovenus aranensis]